MMGNINKEILRLTKELVAIPSINGTPGERIIAEHIADLLREIPYFKVHPEYVMVRELDNDPLKRLNVFGLIKGEKSARTDTVILHGHIDTVGIEDFASIKEFAFDCESLPEKIRKLTSDVDVLNDIESGEWLFGRGASDMKCGVALNFVLSKQWSENVGELDGNILFMVNPVEENQHTGIMDSLTVLEELKKEHDLNYYMAINTDFISPAYPGDTTNYFHAGAVGKILPCFYAVGKPTHAGQGFEGFSASMTIAEIVRQLDLRADFADEYNDEYTQPPIALKVKDLKPEYNVQTTVSAFAYFNYFIHQMSVEEIMERLKGVAFNALKQVQEFTNDQYRQYCRMTGMEYGALDYPLNVYTYEQLYADASEKYGDGLDKLIEQLALAGIQKDTDRREITREIVETLIDVVGINTPTVIVFIAPPYCPRNTLKDSVPEEKWLRDDVADFLEEQGAKSGCKLELKQFFPVLTDSSYLKIDDDQSSVECLKNNFPAFETIYPVPLNTAKRLNIPAFNFGCLGKDAHKWTERVNIPYAFGVLPVIIDNAIRRYVN